MAKSKHNAVAERIAQKHGTTHRHKGVDVVTKDKAIEVETSKTVADAEKQLSRYKKDVYVAGTDKETTNKALNHYSGTDIGVMNSQGKIVKRSSRNRKGRK